MDSQFLELYSGFQIPGFLVSTKKAKCPGFQSPDSLAWGIFSLLRQFLTCDMAALNLSRETDNVWGGFIHIVGKLGKRGDTRLVKIFQLKPELPDFHGKLYLPRKPGKTSLTMKAFNFTSYAKSGSTMFYQANARLLPRCLVHRYIDDVANSSCMPEPYDSGAPNDNFRKIICSEDDLRSRIFGSFSEKNFACLPLLGFSNILKMV